MTTISHLTIPSLFRTTVRTPRAAKAPQKHGRHLWAGKSTHRHTAPATDVSSDAFRQIRAEHDIRATSTLFLR